MRHGTSYKQLSVSSSHRRAMLRNMATSLLLKESCEMTLTRAKQLRPLIERLITRSRKDSLSARRRAYSYLLDKKVVHKLFTEIGPRYRGRNGGYTRVLRTGFRPGDAAPMAVIQLISDGQPAAVQGTAKKAAKAQKKPAAAKAAKASGGSEKAKKAPAASRRTAKKSE